MPPISPQSDSDTSSPSPHDSVVPPADGSAPYVPPASSAPKKTIVRLSFRSPLVWLLRGAVDFRSEVGIGLFYGAAFTLMAWILSAVFRHSPEYTMTIASGCLLVGPFMAMGLYEVSRRREAGLACELGTSLVCWDRHLPSMAMFVLVLIILELLWGRASLVVFAVFFNTGMPSTMGVMEAVFNPENLEFVMAYGLVGGVFALLAFAMSVVSIPMILDRDTDAVYAVITSIEVFISNAPVMLWWGLLLTLLLTGALLLPWNVGLLFVGPLLGHATWHAYRGSVIWADDTMSA
jgi:uncharacterized membrane protein